MFIVQSANQTQRKPTRQSGCASVQHRQRVARQTRGFIHIFEERCIAPTFFFRFGNSWLFTHFPESERPECSPPAFLTLFGWLPGEGGFGFPQAALIVCTTKWRKQLQQRAIFLCGNRGRTALGKRLSYLRQPYSRAGCAAR